ncbi:MAG: acyl-ACP--UDP-N-acetylglucosamine O-acyltransferase [Gammaproteobacteria bacterium]|nr:MAG: acyl-ACP--UDP-N-acetylglucosamine O-acyltransferase [Gammaproteobacteria bacterium]
MIDSRAVIDSSAKIGSDVTIGPFSVIGKDVEIGDDTWVGPHVVINGPTKIGKENKFFQFASIGEDPQDKKYAGEDTKLIIGDRNVFREYVTINRGTSQDRGYTQVGDDNWIMAYCHIAHDCVVQDNVIMSNSSSLAGHVVVEDYAILAGFALVHQFCKIGAHSFSAFGSVINQDVPTYVTASGHLASPRGINSEGLKRRGFSSDAIRAIKNAYKAIYMSGKKLDEALKDIEVEYGEVAEVREMIEFIKSSERGIIR